jgi:hypothetical protein
MPTPETEEQQVQPLIDVRAEESFKGSKRDIEAALIYATRFADKDKPFTDRTEAGEAADAVRDLKDVIDAAEEARKKTNKPYELTVKTNNMHFAELLSKPKAAAEALGKKGLAFQRAEAAAAEEVRRQEKAKRDREAEEAANEAQAAAELAQEDQTPEAQELADKTRAEAAAAARATAAPPAPAPPKRIAGGHSSQGSRLVFHTEVTNAAAVPDYLKVVSDPAVKARITAEKAAAKAEKRDFNLDLIPGIRIWTEEKPVNRRR